MHGPKELRVGIDYSPVTARLGGVSRYASELVPELEKLSETAPFSLRPVAYPIQLRFGSQKRIWDRLGVLLRDLIWYPLVLPLISSFSQLDVLHMTTINGPRYARQPVVLTIHDLSVIHFPQYYPRWFRTYSRWFLPSLAKRASHIITDAQSAKTDICETFKIPEHRVSVIPLGVNQTTFNSLSPEKARAAVAASFGIRSSYFLMVGTLSPRKNLSALLKAFAYLRDSENLQHTLQIVGDIGWKMEGLERTVNDLGLGEAVRFLGYVADEDLRCLYICAEALIVPSLGEGFGLPVVEAMACGCPVIAARAGSLPEVVGQAGLLCDPTNPSSIADQMLTLVQDPELRGLLRTAGLARADMFSWKRTAELTLDIYVNSRVQKRSVDRS